MARGVALLRLQLRLWSAGSRQWLFSLGLMPDRDATALGYVYAFYAGALGLLWLGASWGALVTLTLQAGSALPELGRQAIAQALPVLFALALAALAAACLLGMPLRLSGPDVAHLTGARPPLRLLTLLRFLPSAIAIGLIALPLGTVLAVLAAGSPRHYLLAMAALVPLAFGAFAGYWALGLLRLATSRRPLRAALWLVPIALVGSAALRLPFVLWPGREFALVALRGIVSPARLALWLLAALVLMLCAGGLVDRTLLADESLRRNLLRSIDAGRRWNAAIAAQQRRAAILSRHRPYLRLPETQGPWLFILRSAVARLRYPASLWGLLRTASILLGGLNLAVLPVRGEAWLLWLLVVMFYPPTAIVEDFQTDMDPQWRQYLGLSPLRVLAADALLPAALVVVVGTIEILLLRLGAIASLSAFLLLVALMVAAALTQAASGGDLGRMRRVPLPAILPAVVGYGVFALFGVLMHAAALAALLLLAYGALLAWLMHERRSIPNTAATRTGPSDLR